MPSASFTELVNRLQTTAWIRPEQISSIIKNFNSGNITEERALNLLLALERNPGVNIHTEKIEDEWEALVKVIIDAEHRIKRTTKFQLYMGLCGLPVFIAIIITCASLGWYTTNISTTFLPILIATLGAVLAHSFFILRTHQQASIAIERLAEKRLAILFLRIAASSDQDHLNAEQLISAGTKMFMSHYAPSTVPLTSEDLAASKSK